MFRSVRNSNFLEVWKRLGKEKVRTTEKNDQERSKNITHLALIYDLSRNYKEIGFDGLMEGSDLIYWEVERGWKIR